jgi:hypothetical protein
MTKLVFWTAAIACLVSSSIAHADKTFRVGKGATWDCKQDPVVSILHGNGKYTFTGACKTITLTGGNNTLTIATTDSISITGAHNKIAIDTVDAINIVGSHNTVTYKSAASGDKPSVSQIGTNNVVSGGAAAKADSKPSDGARPAAESDDGDRAAGGQDCAKNPTAEIDTGDGNYTFFGPCTRIVVNGGENKLKIESVKELSISGSLNTVTVGSVDKIVVPGGENKVTYRKGISGPKPKISSVGYNNTIAQAK